MSRPLLHHAAPRLVAPAARVATGLALVAGLAACGASFDAQTYQERNNAESVNAAAGTIAVRDLAVVPARDDVHEAGDDAEVTFTLVNNGAEDDRLVEVRSPAAASVDIVELDGMRTVPSVQVPRLGTTGTQYGLVLRGLRDDVRAGESVELTLRFDRGGDLTMPVPVESSGEYDYDRERSENFHVPGEHEEEGGGGLSEAGEEQTGGE